VEIHVFLEGFSRDLMIFNGESKIQEVSGG